MRDDHIAFLMEDSHRDLFYAQQFLGEGVYPKSISNSYSGAFYAVKALLLHLKIRSKSHKSVQISIEVAIDRGHLSSTWRNVLEELHSRRNEAVYRYARRDWTAQEARDSLSIAEGFISTAERIMAFE